MRLAKRAIPIALAAIAGAGVLATTPAGAANTANVGAADSVWLTATLPAGAAQASASPSAYPCFANWSHRNQFGSAAGKKCGPSRLWVQMNGTVKDEAADGRCPYVRAYTSTGAHRDSDWAGPKGDTSPVELYTSTTDVFVDFEIRAIAC
ncbi:hypothetical protein GCM10010252_54780 [Streptomyces aureoverticillatus]|nr:hypothetical protein GCM10010252_54780 [Streptomyces aureoverticillatus]